MIEQFKDNILGLGLLILWILILVASVLKFVYKVWFRTPEFLQEISERKKNSPKWLGFFSNSSSVTTDLWIARIVSIGGFVSMVVVLTIVASKLFSHPP